MKQKITILLIFICTKISLAQSFTSNGVNYQVTSNVIPLTVKVIASNTGLSGTLVLPNEVNYNGNLYSVTALSDSAFENANLLTTVSIPNTVISISGWAFKNCSSLTSISIPNSVTSIGQSAFFGCNNLTSITIPNSITSISNNLFQGCNNLTTFTFSNSITSIGGGAFIGCSALSTITIPNTINTIGDFAFFNCTGLSSFKILKPSPIAILPNVFQNVNIVNIPLYVPSGSEAAYEATSVWTDFNPINALIPPSAPTATSQTFCAGATVANLVATGETGATFNWYDLVTGGTALATSATLATGTYYVSQTVSGQESARTSVSVTVYNAITSSISSQTNVACNGGNNGVATVLAGGGSSPYTYLWSNAATSATISGLTAGIYTCTITDANNCTKQQSVTITQPTAIVVSAQTQTNVSCNGGFNGSATISVPTGGVPNYTYNWTPGNPSGNGTRMVTGLSAGTYTCSVTDDNGCIATQNFTITEPGIVNLPSAMSQTFCGTTTVANLVATGESGATFNWYINNSTTSSLASTASVSTGTYYVSQTINGCESARTSVTVTVNSIIPSTYNIIPVSGFNQDIIANGNTPVSVSTTSGFDSFATLLDQSCTNYGVPQRFLPISGNIKSITTSNLEFQLASASASNSLKLTSASPTGTLTLTSPVKAKRLILLGASGNGSSTANIIVNFSDNTTQSFTNVTVSDWFGGANPAIKGIGRVSGTFGLQNQTDDQNPRLYEVGIDFLASNYSKEVTSIAITKLGSAESLNIMGLSANSVNATPNTITLCQGTTLNNAPVFGDNLLWYSSNTSTTPISNTTQINSGSYFVTQTISGCESEKLEVVFTILPLNNTSTTIATCGSYTWSTNNTTYNTSGIYTFTSTNVNGCTDTATLNLTINTVPSLPTASAQTFCGAATVSNLIATAQTGNTLNWYDVATNGTVLSSGTSIATGTYYVSQTNTNNCESARTSVAVTVNAVPAQPTAGSTQQFCPSDNPTITSLNVVGTTGATFNWYNVSTGGAALASTTALTTATYYVSQTVSGCESPRISVNVFIKPAISQVITNTNDILTAQETPGSYQWMTCNGGNFVNISGATSQNYTVTATGSYAVDITKFGCTQRSVCFDVVTLGKENFEFNTKLLVYPNPSNDIYNLDIDDNVSIEVFDIVGKKLLNKTITIGNSQLDLTNYNSSIYLLKVTNSKNQTKTIKLVKE